MKKIFHKSSIIITLISVVLLAIATYLFIKYNNPIIKQSYLFATTLFVNLLLIIVIAFKNKIFDKRKYFIVNLIGSLITTIFIIMTIVNTVVVDYFQPYSLYDLVIYISLAGFGLILLLIIIQSISTFFSKKMYIKYLYINVLLSVFVLQFFAFNYLQNSFEYTNISGDVVHLFSEGEEGYTSYRIPTVLVINEGEKLGNNEVIKDDLIIVMAEARRNSSLDDGDIDLVQKVSDDGGKTWSDLIVVRNFEEGIGKIGNSTPIYDKATGTINLLHIAGETKEDYVTYNMTSIDGGKTWSTPTYVFDGIVGPGHGIQVEGGEYNGRLIAPSYMDGGSLAVYSDDNGKTWETSEQFDDGNEAEISQINNKGDLIITVRTNVGASKPHEELYKLFSYSITGGSTWSTLEENTDIKEPICMSSIVASNDFSKLHYSYPNDFYSRSQMTVVTSIDEGVSWENSKLIYQGASGYSELGVLSNDNLVLVFENGDVEYNERISFVFVK